MISLHNSVMALIGGVLIGAGGLLLLGARGKIAGISGALGGLLMPGARKDWRWPFLLGLVSAGFLMRFVFGRLVFDMPLNRSAGALIAAGLLVGLGTRIGGGCTSGHGICGLARFSKRSLAATLTFMAAGAAMVLAVRHIFRGFL
jgi:uncharacterized membrane protein YedE/YeeE